MLDTNANQKHQQINWLMIAGICTIAYLIILSIYLIPETSLCSIQGQAIQKLLACRSFNELGDFLAGAFAPVAFLWLVAAVLIQAQELRAQREELAMTRQELADSREVMKEQAEQARNQALQAQRQADFIGEQTENLRRQSAEAHQERQDRIFEDLLQSTSKEILSQFSNFQCDVESDSGRILLRFPEFRKLDYRESFSLISRELENSKASLAKLRQGKKWPFNSALLIELADSITNIIEMEENLSPIGRAKMKSVKVKNIQQTIKDIIEMERSFSKQ